MFGKTLELCRAERVDSSYALASCVSPTRKIINIHPLRARACAYIFGRCENVTHTYHTHGIVGRRRAESTKAIEERVAARMECAQFSNSRTIDLSYSTTLGKGSRRSGTHTKHTREKNVPHLLILFFVQTATVHTRTARLQTHPHT